MNNKNKKELSDKILNKIEEELKKPINSEAQIVYLLTRIEIFLKINNLKTEYKYLSFFRNWNVHDQIDTIQNYNEIISDFISNKNKESFLNHDPLITDLNNFLNKNSLPKIDLTKFKKLLTCSLSGIPLIIKKPVYMELSLNAENKLKYNLIATAEVKPVIVKFSGPEKK